MEKITREGEEERVGEKRLSLSLLSTHARESRNWKERERGQNKEGREREKGEK